MGHVKRFPIHWISIFKERSIKSLRISHKAPAEKERKSEEEGAARLQRKTIRSKDNKTETTLFAVATLKLEKPRLVQIDLCLRNQIRLKRSS